MDNLYKKIMKNKTFMNNVLTEEESEIEFLSTGVITLNLLFSGQTIKGIPLGKMSQIAAEPQQGKSFVGLSLLKNAQKKGMQVVVIDTEFSFDYSFAKNVGIDVSKERLLVIQNNSIEDVQQIILTLIDGLTKKERKNVFIMLDSFGGLTTSKTLGDAIIGKDVIDMTVAKKKNNFSKIMMGTGATIFIVNHVYQSLNAFGEQLAIAGAKGLMFACSCVVLGQSKAKEKKSASSPDISGVIITCKTFKSRFGKENSRLKFRIKVDGGLDVFYGLLPDALECGIIDNPTKGHYIRTFITDDKKRREKDMYNMDFWVPIFKHNDGEFEKFLEDKYSFRNKNIDIANVDLEKDLNEQSKD